MANNSTRGLASADEETRSRVARMGGQASRGGGRKGGQSSRSSNMRSSSNRSSR